MVTIHPNMYVNKYMEIYEQLVYSTLLGRKDLNVDERETRVFRLIHEN